MLKTYKIHVELARLTHLDFFVDISVDICRLQRAADKSQQK